MAPLGASGEGRCAGGATKMSVPRWLLVTILAGLAAGAVVATGATVAASRPRGPEIYAHLTTGDTVGSIVSHPAFAGFGRLLLPRAGDVASSDTPLHNVRSLMPYHDHVVPGVVVSALNRMIDDARDGKTIFYDVYTEEEKQDDPTKELTGLLFYRGEPGAPFAIVCPGGGFSYVGSLHEGFPLAVEISKHRYNALVLRYRTDSQQRATEDLAAAIAYVFRNAGTLGVGTGGYSLWGASAGARMVGNIAVSGVTGYGGGSLPKPSTVVIAYTGQASFSKDFPPTFLMVSADDGIVDASVVDQRATNLRNSGVEVDYRRFRAAGHGFGLGTGTDADGWLTDAVRFWERHISRSGHGR